MRRYVIGAVDGFIYRSDWVSDSVLEEELKKNDGLIGQDPKTGRDVYVDSAEEATNYLSDFLKIDDSMNSQTFSIQINKVKRTFNVRHIIWWQTESAPEHS